MTGQPGFAEVQAALAGFEEPTCHERLRRLPIVELSADPIAGTRP